jgi:hypothetical protein
MPDVPRKIFLCACLLAFALSVTSCAKAIEVQAKGQTAVSVGVGSR